MKVYLSGQITGDPDYVEKFKAMAIELADKGFKVMNPAVLPDGFQYEDYMQICASMVMVCDAIYLMPCWQESPGAMMEKQVAVAMNKQIIYGGIID